MNINRDYLIINDVKKSNVKLDNGSMFFYITDKNTQNIFVNLVINISNNDLIQKYANIENAEDYTLTMNIVKPDNTYKVVEGKLHDKEKAIFEFDLKEDCVDKIGPYRCELLTKCTINGHEEITTSNKITYKVKSSILNDLDDIVEAPEYPLVIQLFDKLSDINQYEEDRRANELARQLAEEQRQARFNALDSDMVHSMQTMDDKVVDVENRITAKEQAVDKLVTDTKADIDNYKVAKDQEIDEYKALKDTEINNAITAQDNKIDEAISNQNNRITLVENNDTTQNNRLDTLENKDTLHESRLDAIEAKNQQQDNRLDIVENKNQQQDNRLNVVEAKNVEQDNRLNDIEAIDVSQNNRLDAIEIKNQEQDDRLLDIEKVNKRQDMNLKCLFAESKNNMIDVAEEGNSIYLQNSTIGYTLIDEIKGNTLVNYNKEPNKELILNGNINTSGDNTVTLTEGIDGGLVDVALEGNTLVNVSKTKDSTAITKAYTVGNSGNHIALQGEVDGSCRPVVTGNTLWIDNDTEEVLTAFDGTKNLRLQSTFEDNLVTQEMVDNGEEVADNLGKYRVEYKSTQEDGTVGSTKTLYLNSPLLEGDTIEGKDGGIYHVHRYTKVGLNGSEVGWQDNAGEGDTVNGHGIWNVSFKDTIGDSISICDKLPCFNSSGDAAGKTNFIVSYSNIIVVNIAGATTYNDVINWLNTNKPSVIRRLVEPQYELIEQSNLAIPSYTNGHLDFNTAVPVEKVEFLPFSEELTYLYANTQYTVQFNSDKATTADITLGGTQLLAQSIVAGLNKITITTPSELVDNKLVIDGVGANISKVVVTEATDQDFGYFEGMKSVGECEDLEVVSSNSDGTLSNTQTLTHEPLRAVGNTKDRYVLIDGKWYIERNCKEVVLDGSEDWTINDQAGNNGNYYLVYYHPKDILMKNGWGNLVSDKYFTYNDSAINCWDTKEWIALHGWSFAIGINILKSKLSSINILGFKQWLSKNPTKVIYPLAIPTYEEIDYNPLEVYSDTTHISNNSTIPCNMTIKNTGYNCLLKPSTTYTVSSNLGLNVITTPSILTEDCLRFYDTDTSDITTMKNVMVLEGDYTTGKPIPSHFSGIESAFKQEYDETVGKYKVKAKVVGKNLFDEELELGTISAVTGLNIKYQQELRSKNYTRIPCVPFTISMSPKLGGYIGLRYYDKNYKYLGASDGTKHGSVIGVSPHIPPIGTYYIRFKYISTDLSIRFQIEQGTKSTPYEPYKESVIEFYINEPLRGIGDIKDKVYVKNDKVVVERNCGIRPYEDGDFGTYLTDKIDTVYPLATPTYEEVEYNDVKLFIESFKNSTLFYNSNVPVTSTVHYSYSVPIVDTVAQTANVTDQQDSMIIDLATSVAVMEMMLM